MFMPRAVRLRLGRSESSVTTMTTADQVAALLVAYLRKRNLSRTLKAFLAETSFKDAGVALDGDLETICGNYFLKNATPEKRKTQSGVSESVAKKPKRAMVPDKAVIDNVQKTPIIASNRGSAKEGRVPVRSSDPTKKGGATQGTSSSSDDSDSSIGEKSQKTVAVVAVPAINGASKDAKLLPINDSESSSDDSESEDNENENVQAVAPPPKEESSSSEESEEDEEPAPKKLPEKQTLGLSTKGAPAPSSTSSSSSEDSDSSSEEKSQKITVKVSGKNSSQVANGGSQMAGVQLASVDGDKSSSDESDSEEIVEKSTKAAIPEQEESSSSEESEERRPSSKDQLVSKASSKKSVIKPPSSSSSGNSDSDKQVAVTPKIQPRNVSLSDDSESSSDEEIEHAKVQQKATGKITGQVDLKSQDMKLVSRSSSEDSDSSSEEKAPSVKPVIRSTAQVASGGGKSQRESSSSDDSDTSGEEDTNPVKVVGVPVIKETVHKSEQKTGSPLEESDSSSEEKPEVAEPPQTLVGKNLAKSRAKAASSSEESDSSSDEERQVAVPPQTIIGKNLGKSSGKASSSSEGSGSSSDEEPKVSGQPQAIIGKSPAKSSIMEKAVTNTTNIEASKAPSSSSIESTSDDTDSHDVGQGDKQNTIPGKKKKFTTISVKLKVMPSKDMKPKVDARKMTPTTHRKVSKTTPEKKPDNLRKGPPSNVDASSKSDSGKKTETKKTASVKRSVKTQPVEDGAMSEKATVKHIGNIEALSSLTPDSKTDLSSVKPTTKKRKRNVDQGEDVEKPIEHSTENDLNLGSKSDQQNIVITGNSTDINAKKRKSSQGLEKQAGTKFFQKINADEVEYADPRLQDNSYWAKNGADEGWGAKAQMTLQNVRGKGFRHEKTKKKRGSYKGGTIDFSSHSIKFQDSVEE